MPLIHSPESGLNKTSRCYTTNCWCACCRDILIQTIVHTMTVSFWTHQLFAELQQKSHMKISRGPSELTVFFYLGLFSHECQCAHQLICPKIYQINSIVIIFFLFFSNLITQTEILRLSIQILQTQIVLLQKWPHSHIVIAWCLHYHGHMTWDMF